MNTGERPVRAKPRRRQVSAAVLGDLQSGACCGRETAAQLEVIASGPAGENVGPSFATNAMFTCLHIDSTVQVPAAGRVTTQQFFWFLEGSLEHLLRRARRDLKLQIPATSGS